MSTLLLKGYCASLFQGCTIIASGLNLMYGLVTMAIGGMVALGAYSHQAHYDTIGYMMMAAGIFILVGGAFAMLGACREKTWAVKMALLFIVVGLLLMLAVVGYSASYESSIKTHAKEAFMGLNPQEKKEFETANRCCGFDNIEEGSKGCLDKVPCGRAFERVIQKYPQIAMTISSVGAVMLMLSLLFSLIILNKMNSAKKKQERRARRQGQSDERQTRVHKTTKLGSRFGAAKDSEPSKV